MDGHAQASDGWKPLTPRETLVALLVGGVVALAAGLWLALSSVGGEQVLPVVAGALLAALGFLSAAVAAVGWGVHLGGRLR